VLAGLPALLWNPSAQVPVVTGGQLIFDITGTPNIPIAIESSTDVTATAWSPVATNVLENGLFHFLDPDWAHHQDRFYRIRWP
jgi:hypothetical protein